MRTYETLYQITPANSDWVFFKYKTLTPKIDFYLCVSTIAYPDDYCKLVEVYKEKCVEPAVIIAKSKYSKR